MKSTKKIYILDSSVILNDYLAIYNFKDNDVYILDVVRTEVANKRESSGSVGKNARDFNKEILKLAKNHPEELKTGIKINVDPDNKDIYGTIRVHLHTDVKPDLLKICLTDRDSRDNLILNEAKKIQQQNPDKEVIVVSDDSKFAVDSILEDVKVEEYKHDKLISDIKDIYKGYIYIPVEADEFARLEKLLTTGSKKIFLDDKENINANINLKEIEDDTFLKHEIGKYQKNLISKIELYYIQLPDYTKETLYPNEFIIFQESYEGEATSRELYAFINFSDVKKPFIEPLRLGQTVSGLRSKSVKENVTNIQQEMMIHLSKSRHIEIIAGLGPAGSGKTLLAVASACEDAGLSTGYKQVTNNKAEVPFKDVFVSRTFVTLEKDLGALPGTEEEKTEPLFRPIKDNLNVIMKQNNVLSDNVYDNIHFLTFTYLQGRSINDAAIILDEAQNTHIIDMESFITRSGDNSRIFLTGDPLQVRKQRVGPLNNGLTQFVELFKGCPFFGIVYMQQAVRSKKAEYATILLNQY